METLREIFGHGSNLTLLQMTLRGILVFFIAIFIIRLSGRRSFGMNMPLDIVVTILLGSILSRAVTGASPFFPIVCSCVAIAAVHRLSALFAFHSRIFGRLVKGKGMILYSNSTLHVNNLKRFMISEADLLESVRQKANVDTLQEIDSVYMERNGELSVVKRKSDFAGATDNSKGFEL